MFGSLFNSSIKSVIAIDTRSESIHFYMTTGKDGSASKREAMRHDVESYRARPFDDEFFTKFDKILKTYKQKNPTAPLSKVSLVLPDNVFLIDTITIPTMNKKAMDHSVDLAVAALYKNAEDLRYHTYLMAQNKLQSTYGVVALRKDLMFKLQQVLANNQITVSNYTFFSAAMVNAAISINSKLKNSSFLLMDIKTNSTFFALVVKGNTMGTFSLPFGHSSLYKTRVVSEDLLFDHSMAEFVVVSAKEKARAKQGISAVAPKEPEITEEDGDDEDYELVSAGDAGARIAHNGKKAARKLPKFMIRETPKSGEGFIYENFRIFIKWTLDLIAANPEITSLGQPEKVYVNMPHELDFLYDMINAEAEEHKITFAPLTLDSEGRAEDLSHLEIHGGLYVNLYNGVNNF